MELLSKSARDPSRRKKDILGRTGGRELERKSRGNRTEWYALAWRGKSARAGEVVGAGTGVTRSTFGEEAPGLLR